MKYKNDPNLHHGYFKMPFGRYKGVELDEIYVDDPGYLEWCRDTLENDDIRETISEFLTEAKGRIGNTGR